MMSVSPKSLGVKTRATPCSRSRRASPSGMIPPTTTGTSSSPASCRPSQHRRHHLQVRAGQDRQADDVHVLLDGGRDDLRRGEPDALVDHLEAGVAGADGDLLGAVGVPVEPRLADQEPQPAAELLAGGPHPLADVGQRRVGLAAAAGRGHAGGRAVLAEHLAQHAGPLPRGHAGAGAVQGRRHQVRVGAGGLAAARPAPARTGSGSRSARHFCTDSQAAASTAGSTVMIAVSRSAVSGLGSVVSNLLTPTTTSSPLSIRRRRSACEPTSCALHVAGLDGRDRAAHLLHAGHLGPGALDELGDLLLDDDRAVEQVLVLEQVGLEGQHLLQPQRPLLVPRPRQAQRLVPGRQLDRAGAGVLGERDGEHLQHDPLDVVLRLRLGQAERVDLHAVAEPPVLGVLRRRSAPASARPRAG